jgi:sterol desaturase/sphingolipid hydroxylase (fatty acid hydroxylase superfamily)
MHRLHLDWDELALPLTVVWALCMIALERRFPYDRGQRLFREGFVLDLFWYSIVEGTVLGFLITALARWLGAAAPARWHVVSDWPVLAQLAFFWVTHDLYIYWFHRFQHRNRYLWRVHEAHHSGRDVDWLAGSRSHALEILINQTIEYVPIWVLGAAPEVAAMKAVLDSTWGMFIHSNIDVRLGWLQYFLNGPEAHRWHHADDERVGEQGVNYATKIALWDWIFGTGYLPRGMKPRAYGLWGGESFPGSFFRQHLHAFRAFQPTRGTASAPGAARTSPEDASGAPASSAGAPAE